MADTWIREARQVTSDHVNKTVDSKYELNGINNETKQLISCQRKYKRLRWKDDLGFFVCL